jgi:hypothetical protein
MRHVDGGSAFEITKASSAGVFGILPELVFVKRRTQPLERTERAMSSGTESRRVDIIGSVPLTRRVREGSRCAEASRVAVRRVDLADVVDGHLLSSSTPRGSASRNSSSERSIS